jgi:hypothetical protein
MVKLSRPLLALVAAAVVTVAGLAGCATAPPPDVVYIADGPPPLRTEVIVTAPGPDFVWVPGWWNYDRVYVWVPGSWQRPPRARATWTAPIWRHTKKGWYRIDGRWR